MSIGKRKKSEEKIDKNQKKSVTAGYGGGGICGRRIYAWQRKHGCECRDRVQSYIRGKGPNPQKDINSRKFRFRRPVPIKDTLRIFVPSAVTSIRIILRTSSDTLTRKRKSRPPVRTEVIPSIPVPFAATYIRTTLWTSWGTSTRV